MDRVRATRPGRAAALLGTVLAACTQGPEGPAVSDRPAAKPSFLATAVLPDLDSMDVYVAGGTLHALVAGATETGSRAVYYLRSPDGGRSWSKLAAVSQPGAPPVSARHGNDVQIAAAGDRLVAAWPVEAGLPGLGRVATAFSADGGKTWEPGPNPAAPELGAGPIGPGPSDIDQAAIDQGYIDLAADRLGHFHLVWLDDRAETGRHSGVRYTRSLDGGRHWAPDTTLDPASCTCCRLALASAEGQRLAVLYRDYAPHDMALLGSADLGLSWRREGAVGAFNWAFTGCPHAGGALVMTGGTVYGQDETLDALVWTGREPVLGLYHLRSNGGGRHFGAPVRLGDASARHGDLAVLDRHHLVAVWETGSANGSRIVIAESPDGGSHWSEPEPISRAGVGARRPRIAATPAGPRVFWSETGPNGTARWAMASPRTRSGAAALASR